MAQGVKVFFNGVSRHEPIRTRAGIFSCLRPENGNQPRIYPRDVNHDEFKEILSLCRPHDDHRHGRYKLTTQTLQTYLLREIDDWVEKIMFRLNNENEIFLENCFLADRCLFCVKRASCNAETRQLLPKHAFKSDAEIIIFFLPSREKELFRI